MISSIKDTISNVDPVSTMYESESIRGFVSFCSFVCVIKNKKMNLPNIFLWLLKDKALRDTFKMLSDLDTDYEVLKYFLDHDPTLYKSKYIRNFLNENEQLELR